MIKIDLEDFDFDYYDLLHESGLIRESEEITEDVLESFDYQLEDWNLELVMWSNGSALEWMIKPLHEELKLSM